MVDRLSLARVRFFLGVTLGLVLAAPLASLAEITIPEDPFVGGDAISADTMNDYMNQLRLHLQAPVHQSEPVVENTYFAAQVVSELQILDALETLGGPVRVEFVPVPTGDDATGCYIEASSGLSDCAGVVVLERQTDDALEWTRLGELQLLNNAGDVDQGSCGIRLPPAAFSTTDFGAPAGAHRYRVRVVPGMEEDSLIVVRGIRLAAYELRGVLPVGG